MISSIEGNVVERGADAVIEVGAGAGALGLSVLLCAGDAERLPPEGASVRLWTHLAVREDAWTLYGFLARETRTLFRLLIGVSGIGPKVALGMLSGASPAEIGTALHRGDEKALIALPGVGKKSAARLVVELSAKVPADLLDAAAPPPAAGVDEPTTPEREAALEMLTGMGLPPAKAAPMLDAAAADDPEAAADAVSWVRAALRRMS